ncbi:MAG: asparagine synthase [Schwartzia sp.]|nr:asparagine synthase [Schwartzia sp. (in: firmicutes)]
MKITGFLGFYGIDAERHKSAIRDRLSEHIDDAKFYGNMSTCITYSKELEASVKPAAALELRLGKEAAKQSAMESVVIINDELRLQRDYWGTRNVYYAPLKDGILFASDIKLILSSRELPVVEYDIDALEECSSLGYIYQEDATLFRGIKQVKRNEILRMADAQTISFRKNHEEARQTFLEFDDAYGAFLAALEDVVRDSMAKLQGDKLFLLSGGMDSTALSIIAAQCQTIHTATFSSGDNKEDVFYADSVAKLISSHHREIVFPEDAIRYVPEYLHSIEALELDGIFSPLGGFAYYLFAKELSCPQGTVLFPGEGADELLAGYYWPFTHPYGFVDKLKQRAMGHHLHDEICKLFPLPEEKERYRGIVQTFLLGTALTNYHLNCIEHTARKFKVHSVPLYMDKRLTDVLRSLPISWLCNDHETKLPLRKFLLQYLSPHNLASLVLRKKLAMPSVIPKCFLDRLHGISSAYKDCKHPYGELLDFSSVNCMMFDILHKYFTLAPMESPDAAEWEEDIERMEKFHEPIVHW